MFSLREYREPKNRLCDYLPWAVCVAPGVVLQKDGLFQKTIAFRGPDVASFSDAELMHASLCFNQAMKFLGTGWSIFIEAQRYSISEYPKASWPHPVAELVDEERRAAFAAKGAHFESCYYLTFVSRLKTLKEKRLKALFFESEREHDSSHQNKHDLNMFVRKVREVIDLLSSVFVEIGELDDLQTLSYLHSTISTERHSIAPPAPMMYLDAILPEMSFTPGDIPRLGRMYMPIMTVTGFPGATFPCILDDLNHLELEYRWITRFICMDKGDAQAELTKYRKRWWQKRKTLCTLLKEQASGEPTSLLDNDATNKAADADAALQELGHDFVAFGYLTMTLMVWDLDVQVAIRKAQAVKKAIQSRGFNVRDENFHASEAWLGSLPGHVYGNIRRPLVHSLNLAHMIPLSAIWTGDEINPHLKSQSGEGAPHIICSTSGDTPFRLHLAVGDVGHTLVIGPTGAGKSTLLSMLALGWLRYPNAQIIIFDKDKSARGLIMALNGSYSEPGEAAFSFQPLRNISESETRIWAVQFILNLLKAQNVSVMPHHESEIERALEILSTQKEGLRTLSDFCDAVQNSEIRESLTPYRVGGRLGHLFDAKTDSITHNPYQLFEMGPLMSLGEDAVVPALDYLFYRVEKRLDGRVTLMILDEAWLFLSHPVFMLRLKTWLKTLRKKNVYVVFATQEISDAASSPIMPTILSACHTKIFLPDEEAKTPSMANMYHGFGLTDTELNILVSARKKRDYYYRSPKGRRIFTLDLGEVALTFTAMSDPESQRFLSNLLCKSDPKTYGEEMLRYRGLDWAVEPLRAITLSHMRPELH